jgi:HD-like signal output (HDOD) protein
MSVLTQPLSSVNAYVEYFTRQPLPVLRHTTNELATLREDIENVTQKDIAAVVLTDPLMTLRLLGWLEAHRRDAQNHDIATVSSALVMMGVEPFFKVFQDLTTVEEVLADKPQALLGLLKVIRMARKAAHYAHDWAVVRHDFDVDEITIAALLRQVTDLVCWINAPDLTQQVYAMQRADRNLRSTIAQREVFGTTAHELQLALIQNWHLPELLVHLLDESQADHPRVRTITLAADFARHVSAGWENAALPDDIATLSALLRIPPEALMRRIDAPEEYWPRLLPAAYAALPASSVPH